jgi:Cellulase (glycosyl hydrolase family 5)
VVHPFGLRPPPDPGLYLLPGRQLVRGANLMLKPAHTSFADLFAEWDWTGWVRWQIDLAASAGANCVRLIGDVAAVHAGTFPAATYRARWAQLIDYATSVGLATYVCGGGASQFGAMTTTDITAVITELAREIDGRPDVLAFDVLNEAHWSPPPGSVTTVEQTWAGQHGATVIDAVRAVCDRPLTLSVSAMSARILGDQAARDVIAGHVDFFDYHLYYDVQPADVDRYWAVETKPLLFGEFGAPATDGQAAQLARYQAARAAVSTISDGGGHPAGALVWSIADDAFGMWTSAGVPRRYLLEEFSRLPAAR